jgi:hypothetical protein
MEKTRETEIWRRISEIMNETTQGINVGSLLKEVRKEESNMGTYVLTKAGEPIIAQDGGYVRFNCGLEDAEKAMELGFDISMYGIAYKDTSEADDHQIHKGTLENNEVITRSAILSEAKKCVCGDREEDYGSPESNFNRIAALWSAYFDKTFTAKDVAMAMSLMKIARIKAGTKSDSYVDLAGYAACAGEIESYDAYRKKYNL